jgi:hypothetical protein
MKKIHSNVLLLISAALGLLTFAQVAISAERSTVRAPLTERELIAGRLFRGSLVNMTWDCSFRDTDIETLSLEMFLTDDLGPENTIYIAPIFGRINGEGFYGGIQTNVRGWRSKRDRSNFELGRGAIFSRWAEDGRRLPIDYADGDSTAIFESDNYEGSFVSVRKAVPWRKGVWRFEVRRQPRKDSQSDTAWFSAHLIEERTKAETTIGMLRFDGKAFKASQSFTSFVEIYGLKHSGIPRVEVGFKPPILNGIPCGNRDVHLLYQSNLPNLFRRYVSISRDGEWVIASVDPAPLVSQIREERIPY